MVGRYSEQPFGAALRALMSSRSVTFRQLADLTQELDGKGMTRAHINMLATGRDLPSIRAMELIAKACDVGPDYFAEYRLKVAMRELDPAEVGLEQALKNLDARLAAKRRAGASKHRARAPRDRPRPTG